MEASDAEIIVQADADCFTEGLADAVAAVEADAAWAVPHLLVHRLSEEGTAAVLAGEDWRGQPVVQRPYPGILGGGILVAHREVLLDCHIDPRFKTWGQEDESHAFALTALYGVQWRGEADLVHLFHPPAPRQSRRKGSPESWQLGRRYFKARNDPEAMRALLEEAKCPLPA